MSLGRVGGYCEFALHLYSRRCGFAQVCFCFPGTNLKPYDLYATDETDPPYSLPTDVTLVSAILEDETVSETPPGEEDRVSVTPTKFEPESASPSHSEAPVSDYFTQEGTDSATSSDLETV